MKRRFATLFAAAALAAPAWAQQPEPDKPQIVVEGRRDQDKQIRELLKALPPVPINRTFEHASRLTDMAHPALTGSVLVIETKALVGLTAVQIADYAVMRTLTGIDPARVPQDSPQSILKVLDAPMGGETPITVTRWDVAFLRSFYSANTSLYAPAQRGEITAAMLKDLQRNGDPATGKQD